ncbi:MAG: ATP-binding cassette domain-containing protein [Verrucomicrobiales bacterium]|nr:ATP-binding cassette domain-containing protein [Verrucomicrobiales bacterium]
MIELDAVDVPAPWDPENVLIPAVQWRVETGDRWLVAGGPGSGKSSLLAVAAGLVRPLRGRHRVFGRELPSLTEAEQTRERLRLGVVFGGGGRLFSQWTLVENLVMPVAYHATSEEEVDESWIRALLDEFELGPWAQRMPRELPRRVAQRAALARALALRPEALLLDDPVLGLPASEVLEWVEYVASGARRWGVRTWVIAVSDPEPWRRVASKFALVEPKSWRVVDGLNELEGLLRPATSG